MSHRFARETILRAFSKPCAAVTLPGTTVNARTSSSGEFNASMIAIASSVPGSVSMITLRGPAGAIVAIAKQARIVAANLVRDAGNLLRGLGLTSFEADLHGESEESEIEPSLSST
jgi:hypothetical protein